MKKCLAIMAAAALAGLFYLPYATGYFDKSVIVLKNGDLIGADNTWESGDELLYKDEGEIYLLERSRVDRVEKRGWPHLLLEVKNRLLAVGSRVADPVGRWWRSREPWRHPLMNPLLAAVLAAGLLAGLWLMRALRDRARRPAPAPPEAPPLEPAPEPGWPPAKHDVVRFFLNIYRQQIGAPAEARAEFVQLTSQQSSAAYEIYELRVRHGGEWSSRRMTIAPLGEDSGSKSKCFYVIFDVHLVVKLPAQRITDFDKYIASIQKERRIVDQLAPRECIVPNVSVILSLVHSLGLSEGVSEDVLEEKYVQWLRKFPGYIDCLKINNGFVYFMDLSRYYFLAHIIGELHDLREAVPAEIMHNPEIIWDPAKFKGRYGEEHEAVCFEIQAVYAKFEAAANELVRRTSPGVVLTPYTVQCWFLGLLAGRPPGPQSGQLSPDLYRRLQERLKGVLAAHKSEVGRYLAIIRQYVNRLRAEQDKQVMAGIAANLLDLLAWLGKRRVAMRDLKPDNLLVAGDPQKYPHFLRSPEEYCLGIIDVETAVIYEDAGGKVKQPLLGGTPFYATPSHFIRNPALRRVYGDLGTVLHLQDWFAVMVMIYRVVTGELLFEHSAKLFGHIKNKIMAAIQQNGSELSAVESVSRWFWRSAGLEFQAKVRRHEKMLKSVSIEVPAEAVALLQRFLKRDVAAIERTVRRLIEDHPVLGTGRLKKVVLAGDHGRISQLAAEFGARDGGGLVAPALFNRITGQKLLAARKRQLLARLACEAPRMSAHELLILMFNTVLKNMYCEQWQGLAADTDEMSCPVDDEISLATTI